MILFAIRKIGTNLYLPRGQRHSGAGDDGRRGFTFDEPIEDGGPYGPRMFVKRGSAQTALRCWAAGRWGKRRTGGVRISPVPGRSIDDMEIASMTVRVSL